MSETIDQQERDDQVLELRASGASYARIARTLGFAKASEANHAFLRAMRLRPEPELAKIRDGELARLDELAKNVRADPSIDETDRERRLGVVDRLRERLLAS